jgi:glutathione synthase/RimK-type ligase-like ATP-grasp enzyme
MKKFKSIDENNYNANNSCRTYYGVNKENATNKFFKNGCCQAIISIMQEEEDSSYWWKILVSKSKAISTLSCIGISLDEYLNEFTSLGFPAIAELEEIDGDYVFHINNNPKNKHSYYLFCWLRHLYYMQNIVINYFHYKKEWELSTNLQKYNLLGFLHYNLGGYSIFYKRSGNFLKENVVKELQSFKVTNQNNVHTEHYTEHLKNYQNLILNHSYYFENFADLDEYLKSSLQNIPKVRKTNAYTDIQLNGKCYVFDDLNGQIPKFPIRKYYNGKTGITIDLIEPFLIKQSISMTPLKVLSRHPSHEVFRKNSNLLFSKNVLLRLGSITVVDETKYQVKINSIPSIQRSSNKFLMKQCFDIAKVPTTKWTANIEEAKTFEFPIIAKHIKGSRGTGNYKLDSVEDLIKWSTRRNLDNYIYEVFFNSSKEYRIHVSTHGVFLAWRKLRRNDTPDNQKWFFNNINCNWISEQNELFDTPKNWDAICTASVAALNAVGLTIGAVDVRVQSNKKKAPEFCIIEINSAPSASSVMAERYVAEINKIVEKSV